MLLEGEKYACEACVRGHRVTNCQHNDRPLIHINKKGRPVSQCHHCQHARKNRASHVKCDCAKKGHTKADCPNGKIDKQPEPHTCCCQHGSRCSCTSKGENHLDTVPEDGMCDVPPPESYDIKPRSSIGTPTESKMTVFTNGHHKPVHKHNDAAHRGGLPYTIPRTHSILGHSEIAQRSVDSLPHTRRSLVSPETPQHHDSITSAPQPVRRVKSEHGSPELNPTAANLASLPAFPTLDATNSPHGVLSGTSSPIISGPPFSFPEQLPENYFNYQSTNQEYEPPLHSAGLNAPPVDWSTYQLPYDGNGDYSAAPSQPPSYASHEISYMSHPGLASSSGEISEADDYPNLPDFPQTLASRLSAQEVVDYSSGGSEPDLDPVGADQYRLSSASSIMADPQQANAVNMLSRESVDNLDIDEYLRAAEEKTREMEAQSRQHANSVGTLNSNQSTPPQSTYTPPQSSSSQPPTTPLPQAPPLHGLTISEAQKFAHMNGNEVPNNSTTPDRDGYARQLSNASGEDPMWSNPDNISSPEEENWDS